MFGPIIDIDKSGTAILDKRYFKLVPEFFEVYKDKNLGSKMLLYIVSVYDKRSPYRHLPYEVRKEDVEKSLFGDKKNSRCSHPKVQAAIELYKYIQYDPLVEQYNAIVNKGKEKLNIYKGIVVTKDNIQELNITETKMQASLKSLEDLKVRINAEEEENKIMGRDGTNLSFIEERIKQFRVEEMVK